MPKPFETIPEIADYPAPQQLSFGYEFVVRPVYITEKGGIDSYFDVGISLPRTDCIPIDEIHDVDTGKSNIAWVEFYQRAMMRLHHPARFEGDQPGPSNWMGDYDIEVVRGLNFDAARPQLVIDASPEGLTFSTVGEVVEAGEVTPFMLAWLERFSQDSRHYGFGSFLLPVLEIIPPGLAKDIQTNKLRGIFKS